MKKRNEKGFFLVETMFVISVVAVVLLIVFKLFTSVYYGFLESENYNTVNAINALSNIQKYYESIGKIDTSLLSQENTYIELTNDEKYASTYYTRIKEEYGVTDVYLIDLEYFLNSNSINNFPVLFRRYLKTLKNVDGIALVICTNGSEFSYVKIKEILPIDFSVTFSYIEDEQTFVAPYSGYYKIEAWGAQGGSICSDANCESFVSNTYGGYGGYSTGKILLEKDEILYVNVGGSGQNIYSKSGTSSGGYNGGGGSAADGNTRWGGGGGATHFAIMSGELKDIGTTNISKILIVSGGGGGGGQYSSYYNFGGSGGGVSGNNGQGNAPGNGGSQISGGAGNGSYAISGTFGLGGGSISNKASGGGGGLYGGGTGYTAGSGGGGGSGYIGNSLLTDKYMYCYNCATSDVVDTKTYTTTCASETPTENCAKIGNGYAKITYLWEDSVELVGNKDDEYGVYINVGGTFTDPGYTGWDGNPPQTEWENGKVLDTNTPGTYYLHYNFDGYLFRRKVEVFKEGHYAMEFSYTGSEQEYRANLPGYYKVELWGAPGGNSTYGGKGGYTSGVIKLNKGAQFYIYVGGMGPSNASLTNIGGYNGGGYSGNYSGSNSYGGGGATDIRISNGLWNDATGLNNRIMVAAGGAGTAAALTSKAGYGGGLIGGNGTSSNSSFNTSTYLPIGSGQNAAGFAYGTTARAGSFGYAYQSNTSGWGGGGGGGYYGGGNGHGTTGAGGSSFISGYAGVNAITSSTDRTHTNNTLHYSNKYFINGKMQSGVNEGNGKAKITYLGSYYPKTSTKLNNTRYIKDCVNGSTSSTNNHWTELQAIYNGLNVAKGKSITGTSTQNSSYPYSRITDGDITYSKYAQAGTSGSLQCVVVDLENTYDLDEIAVWHYYGDTRSYKNHSLYVSSDNTTWTTLIDNVSGVTETSNGIRVSAYE